MAHIKKEGVEERARGYCEDARRVTTSWSALWQRASLEDAVSCATLSIWLTKSERNRRDASGCSRHGKNQVCQAMGYRSHLRRQGKLPTNLRESRQSIAQEKSHDTLLPTNQHSRWAFRTFLATPNSQPPFYLLQSPSFVISISSVFNPLEVRSKINRSRHWSDNLTNKQSQLLIKLLIRK